MGVQGHRHGAKFGVQLGALTEFVSTTALLNCEADYIICINHISYIMYHMPYIYIYIHIYIDMHHMIYDI